MMIGSPHIDYSIEAPLVFVDVIRDVRSEIGQCPIALAKHPILVITEARGPKPERTLMLKGQATLFQQLQRALHPARVVRTLLGGDDIEANPELFEIPVLFLALNLDNHRSGPPNPLVFR